ncbi:putative ribosomal protein l28e protein [Naviculisporaceae sp. PSN 640]
MSSSNISADLIWEIVRSQNSYTVANKSGPRFSRDPLNLLNVESRKYAGFVNDKAIGITPAEKGGVTVVSKKAGFANKPAQGFVTVTYGGGKTARKTYKAVANQAAKRGYRSDLRALAVARVSAIRKSQRPTKADPVKKLRGNAAKKAASA